ncbi:MAG: hypothetical protein ABFE02_16820, partial [Sulfuricella sp.]
MSTPASRTTTSIPVSRFGHLVHAMKNVMTLREPADANLHYYFRVNRELGGQDRAFIADNIYAALRRKRLLEHLNGALSPNSLPEGERDGVSLRETGIAASPR